MCIRDRAKAEDLAKRARDGAGLDAIATELGVEKQTKRGLKREADDVDFGKSGVADVFALPPNGIGVTASPQGDARILFKVTEVFEPAASGPDAVPEDARKAFSSGMADDLLDELVAVLQAEYGVSIDRAAISQALTF